MSPKATTKLPESDSDVPSIRQYRISLTEITPLLPHNNNIDWRDEMDALRKTDGYQALSDTKKGDDRHPGCLWLGHMYIEDGLAVVPSDNLMALFRDAGKRVATGKVSPRNFQNATQGGIVIDQISWPIQDADTGDTYDVSGLVEMARSDPLRRFKEYADAADDLGFELWAKPGSVNRSSHVRVRPRFRNWKIEGTISVFDRQLDVALLTRLLTGAGRYVGCCDWRPGSPKGGQWGKFTPTVTLIA